jgi:hypothetical protein
MPLQRHIFFPLVGYKNNDKPPAAYELVGIRILKYWKNMEKIWSLNA